MADIRTRLYIAATPGGYMGNLRPLHNKDKPVEVHGQNHFKETRKKFRPVGLGSRATRGKDIILTSGRISNNTDLPQRSQKEQKT